MDRLFAAAGDPVDIGTLFAPAATGATDTITTLLPYGIGVFVLLSGIGIALKIFGKFGVRR